MTCTAARDGPAVPMGWRACVPQKKKKVELLDILDLENYGGKPNNKYFSSFFHENLCNY